MRSAKRSFIAASCTDEPDFEILMDVSSITTSASSPMNWRLKHQLCHSVQQLLQNRIMNRFLQDILKGFFRGKAAVAVTAVPVIELGVRIDAELSTFASEPPLLIKYKVSGNWVYDDPLMWWKSHSAKYSLISRVAKALLCITATSAPSERLFSSAGLTIAANRARMHGDNAAALIFLHAALPVVKRLDAEHLLGDSQGNWICVHALYNGITIKIN